MSINRKQVNVNVTTFLPTLVMMAGLVAGALFLPIDRQLAMEMLLVFAMAQGWNFYADTPGCCRSGITPLSASAPMRCS